MHGLYSHVNLYDFLLEKFTIIEIMVKCGVKKINL